jgi:drug/metabolite transporter (DMT)-like permease
MPERRDLAYFAFLGFLGITFHQWLQSTGLQTARASTTSWIVATTPIFIAILGRLLLGERLGWLRSAGIGLAAWGVLLVVTGGDFRPLFSGHFGSQGDILILISAVNWAVFTTFSRSGLQRHPAARMMFFVMVAGWIFTTLLFLPQASWNEIAQLSPEGWASILFLGLFCSGLAYIFWYDALQNIPASQAGAFLYLEPLVTLVLSALILLEDVTWVSATGGATILLGVWLVNRRTVRG